MSVELIIETNDNSPNVLPHKVSNITGYDDIELTIKISDDSPLQAYIVKFGGNSPISGTELISEGAVCGLAVCGVAKSLAISVPSSPASLDIVENINYDDLPSSADGAYPLNVYVYHGGEFE